MLEMGINQFSIYASFKNKCGVLRESLRCYRDKMKRLMDKLEASPEGVSGDPGLLLRLSGICRCAGKRTVSSDVDGEQSGVFQVLLNLDWGLGPDDVVMLSIYGEYLQMRIL